MSKIGRRPINIANVELEINGTHVTIKGKKNTSTHELPAELSAEKVDDKLFIKCAEKTAKNKKLWGLHRALLANKVQGMRKDFEQEVIITGLGYKGVLAGKKINFSLGYSHDVAFDLPEGITVEIDKSGQKILIKGANKEVVGFAADAIRSLRPPEPYKGTGIRLANEEIIRKEGKKSA